MGDTLQCYVSNLQVHQNWQKRMREIMTSHTSQEVMTCIEIALRCEEADRTRRPTISEIAIVLNEIDTVESSPISQVCVLSFYMCPNKLACIAKTIN